MPEALKDSQLAKQRDIDLLRKRYEMITTMTRLFGFTTILGDQHVIGLGNRCFVWHIYMAKVPRRRLKCFWYMADAGYIVHHMKYNSGGKFRFFGYVSIDEFTRRIKSATLMAIFAKILQKRE